MEITKEIIATVFHQYYGKKYNYRNDFGNYEGVVGDFHTRTNLEQHKIVKLILKPISSINEEDATEIANIINYGKGTCELHKFEINQNGIKFSIELKGEFDNDTSVEFYEDGRIKKFYKNAGDNGEYGDLHYNESILIFQYLQSKGYDLPNYLLGGKTLKEAGLAIYKNL